MINFYRKFLFLWIPKHPETMAGTVFNIGNGIGSSEIIEMPDPSIEHDTQMIFFRIVEVVVEPGIDLYAY